MAEEIADGVGQAPTPQTSAPGGQATPEEPADEQRTYTHDYVKKLRDEAADTRRKLREFEAQQKAAQDAALAEQGKFKELYEQAEARAAEAERANLVARVGARHNLPPELAELLRGADEAALEAHALSLAKIVKPSPAPAPGAPTNPARSQAAAQERQKIDPKHPPSLSSLFNR